MATSRLLSPSSFTQLERPALRLSSCSARPSTQDSQSTSAQATPALSTSAAPLARSLTRVLSVALPAVALAGQLAAPMAAVAAPLAAPLLLAFVSAELPQDINTITNFNTFELSEEWIKGFYMVYICAFCWGCAVFASTNDPYYESDDYRKDGGNGTQFWLYERPEEVEEEAREELWREELRNEIEAKMSEVKELQEDKEKQLVR